MLPKILLAFLILSCISLLVDAGHQKSNQKGFRKISNHVSQDVIRQTAKPPTTTPQPHNCECMQPSEIILNEQTMNWNPNIWPTNDSYNNQFSYCVPMNCTWKVINNYTDPNIIYSFIMWAFKLRENSSDFLELTLPNNGLAFRYTWENNVNAFGLGEDIANEPYFYVHFETGGGLTNDTGFEPDYQWQIGFQTDYRTCACSAPSTAYIYNPDPEMGLYAFYAMMDVWEENTYYCVPMTCDWKVVNYLDNYAVNVTVYDLTLRNGSADYIQIGSSNNKITYQNNGQSISFNVTDKEFTISFHAGDPANRTRGVPPSFAVLATPMPLSNSNPVVTTTPAVPPTTGPICECEGPFEYNITDLLNGVRIIPTRKDDWYCYNMTCDWKIYNNLPYDNNYLQLYFWEIALRNQSKDHLEVRLGDGTLIRSFTYNDTCIQNSQEGNFCSRPWYEYSLKAKELTIHFETGAPPEYDNIMNLTHGYFDIRVMPQIEMCDCVVPSTYFLAINGLEMIEFGSGDHYCVPQDCSWKFINGMYNTQSIQVNIDASFRNTCSDYMEARNSKGDLLFRIDGTNTMGMNTYIIDDKVFNITFHSDKSVPQTEGILPYWILEFNNAQYVPPLSTPSTPSQCLIGSSPVTSNQSLSTTNIPVTSATTNIPVTQATSKNLASWISIMLISYFLFN